MKAMRLLATWVLCVLGCASAAAQTRDFEHAQITTVPVSGCVHMVTGLQRNIAACTGSDGVLLVDALYAPLHQKIVDAVAKISNQPLRFLINTHWHADHVGGDELMAKAGAMIVAHDNVRRRMSTEQPRARGRTAPYPQEALPVLTFNDSITFHYNGEEIRVFHVGPAHTDSDSVVYFRRANVIDVGDLYTSGGYPLTLDHIDRYTGVPDGGGSLGGVIAADDQILKLINPTTKIISGHSPLATPKELREYRDTLATIQDRILRGIRAGKTVEEIIASQPTAEFDQRRTGEMAPDEFVKFVYGKLLRDAK